MKLRHSLILGAACAAFMGLGSVGCGDDSSTSSGAGGDDGTGTGTGDGPSSGAGAGDVVLTKPPARPSGAPPGDGDGAFLGITHLYLGETDRSGTEASDAWEGYGFDLDGIATVDVDGDDEVTGADLTNHCTPVGGEINAGNVEDGAGGVDNSFGRNILSFIKSILPGPSETASEAIEDGGFTLALNMTDLGDGTEYDGIKTNLYAGIDRGADGAWLYVPALLNNDDPNDPKIHFDNAYVTDNTWVSGEPQTITLNLSISDVDLALNIRQAVVAVELSGDHASGSNGVIAGVLDTEEFVSELGKVAQSIAGDQEGLCPGDQLFDSIVQNIRAASDLMKDGSNGPNQQCDGISIAIGFDMETVVFGDVAPPPEPGEPSSCD